MADQPTPAPSGHHRPAVVPTAVPVLRGWLHLACFVASVPAGLFLVVTAGSTSARAAGSVYAVGLSMLFGVSATYHRQRWSATARTRLGRLDHATIFVMIAASYTPLCVVTLGGALGTGILVTAWTGAAVGAVLASVDIAQKPVLGLVFYIGLGWLMALALPELARRLGAGDLALVVGGGVVYTAGGIVLATRWPDPFPAVFGYHEVWHLMVAVAATCHYVVIATVVRAAA